MNETVKRLAIPHREARRGIATVEFAVIAPLLILMILGGIELGRGVMVKHVLEEAARAGCRVVTLHDGTKQEALDIISLSMQNAKISGYTVTMNPDPPSGQDQKTPVTVSVSVPYSQVTWLAPRFMTSSTVRGTCVMPTESDAKPSKRQKESSKTKKKSKKKQH